MASLPGLRPLLFGGLKIFFVCQAKAEQDAPDRDAVDRDIVTIRQFQHEIIQGQIRLFHHPRFDPATKARQLAVTATIALRAAPDQLFHASGSPCR